MPKRQQILERSKTMILGFLTCGSQDGIVFCAVAVFALYVVLTRFPHLTTVVFPDLSRILEYATAEASSEVATILRTHAAYFDRIVAPVLDKSQLFQLHVATRHWNPSIKDKIVLFLGISDISVIIPALNEVKCLPGCLKSLSSQSYSGEYEIVVIDGGSTDGTVEIARRFTNRVVSAAKRPVGAARNEGARIADGRTVAFIDADTIASPFWLSAVEKSFRDQSVIGVTGPTLPSDGTTLDLVTYRLWTMYLQKVLLSMGMPHVIGFNCAYRKDAFLKVGGFDETNVTSEDIGLARKMRRLGRIKFEKEMSALTSARRFQKYGHAYISGLYLLNGFSTLLLDRSSKNYPPVR